MGWIMWVDDLPPGSSWTTLWSGYIRCGVCSGIRKFNDPCLACGSDLPKDVERTVRLEDGLVVSIPHVYAGAETRYEDYVYLQLMEREWERMTRDSVSQNRLPLTGQVSTGASLVLLFWTYFETRLEHLLRGGLQHVPPAFLEDALNRYSAVGVRLDRFYKNRIQLDLSLGPPFLGIFRRECPPGKGSKATKRVCSWIATEH